MNESGFAVRRFPILSLQISGRKNRRFDQFYILPDRNIEGNDGMLKTILRGGPPPDSISDESGSWRMYLRFFEKQIRIKREVSEEGAAGGLAALFFTLFSHKKSF